MRRGWFLMLAIATPASAADDPGRALYTNCAACHGEAGQGGFAPPFAANPNLADGRYVIDHVLNGSVAMPPFRGQLSPAEIAAVINHIRNNWGNRAEPVSAADVAKAERPR